jgi:GTPase SAR1 family protein
VRTYYRNAQGVFLCIDIAQDAKLGAKKIQNDLMGIESWMTELGQTCTMSELAFCLLGTKKDLGVEPANVQLILKWIDKMKAKY